MIRLFGTIFAGLFGLAFGSFLNVCLSRWPEGERIVAPRSHCRNCSRTLAWWENIPLLSWLILRGRCRQCRTWIGWRYPLVEAAVALLWATAAWRGLTAALAPTLPIEVVEVALVRLVGTCIFDWVIIALAVLDIENLWLPDFITLPGILLAFALQFLPFTLNAPHGIGSILPAISVVLQTLAAAALILLIRWIYWLIRGREGMGLGDAKLMALLAAWLGLPGALLSFVIAVLLGTLLSIMLLAIPFARKTSSTWAHTKLPLGTFLCLGGIVASLWGQTILNAYLRWAGF